MQIIVYLFILLSELKPFAPDPVKQARYEAYLSGKQNPSGKSPQCILLFVHHLFSTLVPEKKKKSLVAWSFLSDLWDQKQEINFVWPKFDSNC